MLFPLATNITANTTTTSASYNYTFPGLKGIDYDYRNIYHLGVVPILPNKTYDRDANLSVTVLVNNNHSTKGCVHDCTYDVSNLLTIIKHRGDCKENGAGSVVAGNGLLAMVVAVGFSVFLA